MEMPARSTPTICRLSDSRRHQFSAIAPWSTSSRCFENSLPLRINCVFRATTLAIAIVTRLSVSAGHLYISHHFLKWRNHVAHLCSLWTPQSESRLVCRAGPCRQAARTVLRNLPTSSFRRFESCDSDFAADSTCEEAEPVSEEPRFTSLM